MIISHKNKFTLLRVPKTGSTSLEAAVRFCGAVDKDDICSATEDASLPVQNIPKTAKQKCSRHITIKNIAKQKIKLKTVLTDEEKKILDYKQRWMFFMEHNTLDDWFNIPYYSELNLISKKQIKEYKHYGFLRDPIERYLSSFVFYQVWTGRSKGTKNPITIPEFHKFTLEKLKNHDNILFRPQKDYFYFEGKQIAEPLLFKDWASEASKMITELGFNPLIVYPRFKERGWAKQRLKEKPTVEDWVDKYSKIRDCLEEHFSNDIEFYKKYI